MEPNKYSFTYKWTQPYVQYNQVNLGELEALRELVIEQMLDAKDFKEADEVIARIKAL